MKISFIVPIYKTPPDTLRKCLKSLQEQSHKDIEVVCVFDGEPEEDLKKMSEEFKSFTWAVSTPQGGAPKARNAGFRLSTGDVVSFWDSDCEAEPEMASVWNMFFEDKGTPCDFLALDYKWKEPGIPGFVTEGSLDPWLLKKYNYLCSMCPIRREKVVEWDESLTGLQDWDFWRRVVDAGAVGVYNQGFGFSTEFPTQKSISGQGLEAKLERLKAIRSKFKDPEPDILVLGFTHKREAIRIAKLLDADYFANTDYYVVRDYKLIISIGFDHKEIPIISDVFRRAVSGTKRAIYWTGLDCQSFLYGPYAEVKKWKEAIKESVAYNFCPDIRAKNALEDVGIEAEILPLPRDQGGLLESLPEKFRILVFTDQHFEAHADAVIKALPDVAFDKVVENKDFPLTRYNAVLHLGIDNRLNEGSKYALIQGRYLISNIEAPYTGYVETSDIKKFKNDVINRIRELQGVKEINREAREFYLKESDPETFRDRVKAILAPALEVVQ